MDSNYGTLSNDDLLALARQAGYLPEEKGEAPGAPDEAEGSEAPLTANAFAASIGATPAITQPSQVSMGGYAGGAVTDPGQLDQGPPSAPPQGIPSVSKGESLNVSGHGLNMGRYNTQGAVLQRGVEGDVARADQYARGVDQPAVDSATYARDQELEAQKGVAKAQVEGIHQEGVDALTMQKLQDDFAVEEARINAAATAQSNQSKADYLAALTDLRASRVDPAQLWHNMTGGERFGTMMSAFVHDFLGAKGINTSAMATLNKAIDRNIDAQVQAIHTKGDVAEGFKSLWYMQRNQAASDAEARARVRGFLLDGAKQAVIANMAPYKAALASAQGQAAVAKINEEFSKNLLDIYKHIDSNAVALRQQAIDIWKERVNASIESRSVGVAEKDQAQRAKQADKVKAPEPIRDPESGQVRWVFPDYVQEPERAKVRESTAAVADVNGEINKLRALIRKGSGTFDPISGTRFAGTDDQEFDRIATNLAHDIAHAKGERATDEDVKDFKKGMRNNNWGNQADAEKVLADFQDSALNHAKNLIRVYGEEIDPQSAQALGFSGSPNTQPFSASAADARNTANPPPKSIDQKHLEKAGTYSTPEVKDDELPDPAFTGDVKKLHERLAKERPDIFTHQEARKGDSRFGSSADYTEAAPNKPRMYEKTVAEYARLAQSSDPEVARQAREALVNLAGPVVKDGPGTSDGEAVAAALVLQDLGESLTGTSSSE